MSFISAMEKILGLALVWVLVACGGMVESESVVFCPESDQLADGLEVAAPRLGLDYSLDCSAPDAVPVRKRERGECVEGGVCVSTAKFGGQPRVEFEVRVELALLDAGF